MYFHGLSGPFYWFQGPDPLSMRAGLYSNSPNPSNSLINTDCSSEVEVTFCPIVINVGCPLRVSYTVWALLGSWTIVGLAWAL